MSDWSASEIEYIFIFLLIDHVNINNKSIFRHSMGDNQFEKIINITIRRGYWACVSLVYII